MYKNYYLHNLTNYIKITYNKLIISLHYIKL